MLSTGKHAKPPARRDRKARRHGLAVVAALAMVMTSLVGEGFAAPALSPPFTECPAIGASPSCGILIVINADGTTAILTDPAVGPYDGNEDTLVGVVNNFGSPVSSLQLSSTKDIFGFDGDGICASSIQPHPAACPFGPTLYEGPGTSYSGINTAKTTGTVNFNAPIPANGGTSYFGLENRLTGADLNIPKSDLSIVKTASPNPVLVGQVLTYTLTVLNSGPSNATGLTVSDPLPANVSFVSVTPSPACGQAGGTVTCSLGALASGASTTITVKVVPNAAAAGTITNTATVKGNQFDNNPSNNSSSVTTTVQPSANLALTKVASPDPVTVGQPLTYTLKVTDNGPSTATGVTVTDTLPASVSFVSASPSQGTCGQAGGTVTCSIGTLANGASATITITVTPNTPGTVTNTATAKANETDTAQADNTATVTTTVNAQTADLRIVKTASPDPVLVGQALTYTIAVSSGGPGTATGVVVTDPLPANVTYVSATPSQGSCALASAVVTCSLGSLANGASASIQIVVRPTAAAVGRLSNTATVKATESDPNTANNTSTVTVTVKPAADLSITKTASPNPVLVGQTLTYLVTVNSLGPNDATGVVVSDPLPANVTYVSATATQGSCAPLTGTVTCTLGTLATGGTATITIKVIPTAAAVGTLTNTATVTSNETDPNSANNTSTVTVTVNGAANLSLTKTGSPSAVLVGQTVTYTLTAGNSGPSTATGVKVVDPLPSQVSYVSSSASQGSCTQASGTVTCALGTLANGASATVTIQVKVNAKGASIVNTATVSSNETDPVPANNTASATTVAYILSGSAFGEQIRSLLINSGPLPYVQRNTEGTSTLTALGINVPSVLSTGVLSATTTIGPTVVVKSSADVADVNALVGVVVAQAVHSECTGSSLTSLSGLTTFAKLDLAGQHLLNYQPAPNMTIAIPGVATVILNEQVLTTPAPNTKKLVVNALHIKTLLGIDIVISQSSCTVDP
ncbi:MAG: hypothetical protein JWM02_753 [Frankiales bacterium]|nr:hypothetical protein [Frankiales bacterium]